MFGSEGVARALIEHGADVNAASDRGGHALLQASEAGQMPLIRLLVRSGANIDLKSRGTSRHGGMTALMGACASGHTAAVRALIGLGADVNARRDAGGEAAAGEGGETALALVSCEGDDNEVGIARLLLRHGADVDAQDRAGMTPLMRVGDRVDLARLLLDKGASVSKADGAGKTALRWCRDAARQVASWGWARAPGDDYELVERLLVERGAAGVKFKKNGAELALSPAVLSPAPSGHPPSPTARCTRATRRPRSASRRPCQRRSASRRPRPRWWPPLSTPRPT